MNQLSEFTHALEPHLLHIVMQSVRKSSEILARKQTADDSRRIHRSIIGHETHNNEGRYALADSVLRIIESF